MKLLWLVLTATVAFAASGVSTPSAGSVLTADGLLVRVSGIAGAFVTTPTETSGAVASGFVQQFGFVKMPGSLRVMNAAGELVSEVDAPPGSAVFGFNVEGDAGVVHYPGEATLNLFTREEWRTVPFRADREVLALRLDDPEHVSAIVAGDPLSLISIRVSDGAVESEAALDNARGPVVLTASGLLFTNERGLVYRNTAGTDHLVIDSADIAILQHMGPGWVQVRTQAGRNLAVRLGPEIRVYDIPEVPE